MATYAKLIIHNVKLVQAYFEFHYAFEFFNEAMFVFILTWENY